MKRRIGVFGGSYDPVHMGHLIMAENFRESLQLDQVVFLPAHVSPFKTGQTPTEDKHRLAMLRLAIGGNPYFSVDDRELHRGGVSYTFDTMQSLVRETNDTEFFLLIGADSLVDFDRWHRPQELLALVRLVVVERGGYEAVSWDALRRVATDEQFANIQKTKIQAPRIEIASREIRQRVRDGRTIRYLVPSSVEAYIREHRLWTSNAPQEATR